MRYEGDIDAIYAAISLSNCFSLLGEHRYNAPSGSSTTLRVTARCPEASHHHLWAVR